MDKIKDIEAWKLLDTKTEEYIVQSAKIRGQYKYVSEYFGDHAENWIVEYDKKGEEISRTSTKVVDYIQWYTK